LDECADHVNKVLTAHGQAFTNLINDEQLVIAKMSMQEENESAAEASRRLNQTTSRKLVSMELKREYYQKYTECLYICKTL